MQWHIPIMPLATPPRRMSDYERRWTSTIILLLGLHLGKSVADLNSFFLINFSFFFFFKIPSELGDAFFILLVSKFDVTLNL